jgi:hypothetical protein
MKFNLLFCLILFAVFNVFAQDRFVKPVDEAQKDESFLAFRTKLIQAAKHRDTKYILSIVDADIKNSFGGDDGIQEFKEWWKINDAKSEFWKEFLPVISNGGQFIAGENNLFCAPFSFTAFPEDLDAFSYSVIFGNNVNLRSKPNINAPIISTLSYNIFEMVKAVKDKENSENVSWYEIRTLGGKEGFIKPEYARSPIDYRACFEKKNGKWKMTAFIAGD